MACSSSLLLPPRDLVTAAAIWPALPHPLLPPRSPSLVTVTTVSPEMDVVVTLYVERLGLFLFQCYGTLWGNDPQRNPDGLTVNDCVLYHNLGTRRLSASRHIY
jgi:hypothetical protein